MSRKPFKQILALMLAVSFLWIFAACVLLCSDSVCENEFSGNTFISVNHNAHNSCPLNEPAKTTTADRVTFDLLAVTIHRQTFVFEPKTFYVDLKSQYKEIAIAKPLDILPLIRI